MAKDPWSRERIDPLGLCGRHGTLREHLARYRFAAEVLAGRVLDAGCGTGYGSAILAESDRIREVVGLDCDARAIAHARRYYRSPRIEFMRADLLDPAVRAREAFDGIACLEVLEHLDEPERLLAALDVCLAPGGRLLLSTPLGRGRGFPAQQPGHRFQLRRAEFTAMLSARFGFRLYGQKGEGIELWRPGGRYFLMLACCRSRTDGRATAGERSCGRSA
jgi:2-polyprenyl-3-methyl-5-hydroxy-6-metoxy-1,4-benzoquinol methylase